MLADGTLKRKTIEGTLFSSGTPALLSPRGSSPSLRPKQIVVAWDSSLEACNAVRRSLHLLQAATEVHVVMIDPEESIHGEEPGADLATYLARHGVNVIVRRLPSQGLSVAAVLKRSAVDTGADLMVMGAYGHSRLRQRIFGGVTLSMTDEPPIPILIAR
jgi:nucleotide-binding universal stress UspA family protein